MICPRLGRALCAALPLMALLVSGCGSTGDDRPNIILIVADDQRFDTLSSAGNELIQTPNLDRVGREGAFFSRAYVTTSLCCPARAGILTSRYAHKTGIRNNEDDAPFLAGGLGLQQVLKQAGYATGFFGKWHIPNPNADPQPGFDRWVSFEGQGQYWDENFNIDGERRVLPGFNTARLFDQALEWMEQQGQRPYLAILSLKNLHRPYEPPPEHRGVLAGVDPTPPPSFHDPLEQLPAYLQRARTTLRNRSFEEDGMTHGQGVRGYHMMMLSFDDAVGRLLGALERDERGDSTALFVTSDGGFMWGEHGMYRKRTAYEPSIHVPLLVRYPREIAPGTRESRLVTNLDIAPTILELCGVPAPSGYQGRSMAGLWRGPEQPWREHVLYIDGWGKFVDGPQELAVCAERYKYVRYRRGEIEEALFDLQEDPEERTNLALTPAHQNLRAELEQRMRTLVQEVDAPASWMEAVQPGSAPGAGR